MRILVTGGAGFIGSHLLEELVAGGFEPVCFDNLSKGLAAHVPEGVRLVVGDIGGKELDATVAGGDFAAICHLAGQTMVSDSIADPLFDAQENIRGTINILRAATKYGVKRVIFASSAAVYGNVTESELPVIENRELEPMAFYGLSKKVAEEYLAMYHAIYGLDYVALRFSNVYGERQGDGGEGGVISIFTKAIAGGDAITIYGDGEQTRDFIYAKDVARGIVAALVTDNVNVAYNLSTQSETSLRELISILSEIAQTPIVPEYAHERKGDIYKSMLSNQRAQMGLKWEPQTSLKEGLLRTYNYFKTNIDKAE